MNAPSVHLCYDDDTLLALAFGRLPPDSARAMLHELERCADCSLVLSELGREAAREAGDEPEPAQTGFFAVGPGDVLGGRFRIVRALGAGGMGEVYEAIDVELGEPLAVKTIRPGLAQKPQRVERFKQEVRLARRVQHPNVCRVLEFGNHRTELGSCYFLTMELLNGETLSDRVRRLGRLSADEVLRIADDLCAGLAAIHAQGILHRDIKTNNVMLCTGRGAPDRAVLLDFGVARKLDGDDAGLTGGSVVGTPEYMAPEQLRGKRLSEASDIYAVGLVLYELCVGSLPFPPDGSLGPVLARLEAGAPRPRAQVPDVSPALDELIACCLEPHADDRPRNVSALRQAISEARAGRSVRSSLDGGPTADRSSSRVRLAFALVTGLIVAGSGAVWWMRSKATPAEVSAPSTRTAEASERVVVTPERRADAVEPDVVAPVPKDRARARAARKEPQAVERESPAEKADCSPPYDYDERGLRVYRKHCL